MFFWAEFQFISICSVSRDITLCWYGSQDIVLFSLTSQELLFLTKHWNNSDISSGKCFFTHFRRSLLQVRDSYSIWEIDSIYLWYFYWIQPFSEVLFARFHLQVLCFRKIYLSVLPSVILFRLTSDKYFSSGFPFQIIYGSAALWFSSFLSDCSVFLYSYPCIRSFLQEIRFLSLPHIDGCDSTFPMDSPSPFSFFHPFHVTFIYAMNWMIFFCAFLVFFWWIYNSTAFFICQHFFVFFSLFFIVFARKYDLICYLF